MKSFALVGGSVLNPGWDEPRAATVIVKGNRFVDILPTDQELSGCIERVDTTGKLLIPGLINAHMHSHANLLRGLCDSWCLEMSLANGSWMAGPRDPDTIYQSTLLGAYEMLANGVTACYDLAFEYPQPSIEGLRAMAAAYRDAGVRCWLAPMIADGSFFDAIPGLRAHLQKRGITDSLLPRGGDGQAILGTCERFFETEDWIEGRLQPAIAPTIALHCSADFMQSCKGLADQFGARMHMHVAESRVQAQAGVERYGDSILAETERLGLLNERFSAAHGVWLDSEDFERLASHGASLVHMPGSNLRLGCGVASIRQALDAGVKVGLATDGANSSDSLSVFRAMQQAALVSRAWGELPNRWLASSDAFKLATEGSAACIGQTGRLGRIEAGYEADCAILDLDTLTYTPKGAVLNQMVNAESGSNVNSVMIAGEWVYRERAATRFNGSALLSDANEAASRWREATAAMRADAEALIDPILEYTQNYGARFSGSHRYLDRSAEPDEYPMNRSTLS